MINKPLIVLAGGFGTRLQSVLNGLPKPLADINGTPFLFYLFQNWINKGFNHFILSLHYEANQIIDFVESQKEAFMDCNISYIIEPKPMGTGGAISYVLNNFQIEDNFFVTNADTWIEDGYSLLNEVEQNVIGIVEVDDVRRFGSVLMDENGFVSKFNEKNNIKGKGCINAGIYKLSKSDFENWDGQPYSIEKDLFLKLVEKKNIKAIKMNTNFLDIGVPEDYFKFCKLKSKSNHE
jgi:D-glycero-alpha-D-manno-heptose 1-phosphate guanylyltransferase